MFLIQIFTGAIFLFSGFSKTFLKKSSLLALGQTGIENIDVWQIRLIGICEFLGSMTFFLPFCIGFSELLTRATALGFLLMMIFAAQIHFSRGEYKVVLFNILLMILNLIIFSFGPASTLAR
ncbi:MAG: DoxX family protein [Saprospiraceae bacterium]|nr:DoxX family protein [Saprospiraceae bacterium]